jgi:hypothetical protein
MIVNYKELMFELLFGKIILVFFFLVHKKNPLVKTLTSCNQGLGLKLRNQGFN